MIKRLKRRFVAINMIIVTLMLCIIFTGIYRVTCYALRTQSIAFMESVVKRDSYRDSYRPFTPPDDEEDGEASESSMQLPYFIVEVSKFYNYYEIYGNSYDFTDDDQELIDSIVNTVLDSSSKAGYVSQIHMRYLIDDAPTSYRIVFADASNEESAVSALRKTIVAAGLAAFLVFFVISCIFANWAIHPVEDAWNQQKQFISDASHELKTPLTVITTNADFLASDDYTPEEKKKFTGNIITVSHQMRSLVEDLLNLSRLDNGAEKSLFAPVNFSSLINDSLLPFEPVFFENGKTLNENIENGIYVKGIESRLKQVADILIDNAGKYATGSEINVTLEKQGRYAVFTVSNNSDYLSQQQLKDIFKRFYRTDEARNSKESFGLGLPIARSICELHKGKIHAEHNEGITKFIVQIPVSDAGQDQKLLQ